MRDLRECPLPLGSAPGQYYRAADSDVGVDLLGGRNPNYLAHGTFHRVVVSQSVGPTGARQSRKPVERGGEEGRAPPAVASRGPESDALRLQDDDGQ